MSYVRFIRWGTAALAASLMVCMGTTAQAQGWAGGQGWGTGGYYGWGGSGSGGFVGGSSGGSYGSTYGGSYGATPYVGDYNYSRTPGTMYAYPYFAPNYSLPGQPLMASTNTSPGMAGTATVATDTTARIHVKVPDGATIWFDGRRTQQGGTDRDYVTPPLETGKTFSYDLQAAWPQGNRLITQTRKIEVTPGGRTEVDFTKPATGEVSTTPAP